MLKYHIETAHESNEESNDESILDPEESSKEKINSKKEVFEDQLELENNKTVHEGQTKL